MSVKFKISTLAIASSSVLLLFGTSAHAQGTYADKAVTRLVGSWVSPQYGRAIAFMIRDGNAIFQDEVEPNVTLTGAYRQDDAGAGYVLRYTQGYECRYNVTVVGADGEEINLRMVSSYVPENAKFQCIQGSLRRTRTR